MLYIYIDICVLRLAQSNPDLFEVMSTAFHNPITLMMVTLELAVDSGVVSLGTYLQLSSQL